MRVGEGVKVANWERSLADLISERGAALKRYAYLMCGDDALAEDLLHDAVLSVFSYPRRGDIMDLEGYVRKAISHRLVDHARRAKVWRRLVPLVATTPSVPAPDADDVVDVRRALLELTGRQRACLVLRYYVDLSIADIAETLGLAEGTVKRHLADGRRRLSQLIQPSALCE